MNFLSHLYTTQLPRLPPSAVGPSSKLGSLALAAGDSVPEVRRRSLPSFMLSRSCFCSRLCASSATMVTFCTRLSSFCYIFLQLYFRFK